MLTSLTPRAPLHQIQRWLRQSNIAQTSTYLAGTDSGQHDAMARFDALRQSREAAAAEAKSDGRKLCNRFAKGM
jgi:hypothetical protein